MIHRHPGTSAALCIVALAGCPADAVHDPVRIAFTSRDAVAASGPIEVRVEGWGVVDGSDLVGGVWSLETWPELEPLGRTFGPPAEVASEIWSMELLPDDALLARWYAVRLTRDLAADERADGIPLADGSVIWRVYGAAVPEVVQIVGTENVANGTRDIGVMFSMPVTPDESHTFESVVTASQAGATCLPYDPRPVGFEGPLQHYVVRCTSLDWSMPVAVSITGLVAASSGIPLADLSVVETFLVEEDAEWGIAPPRVLDPPPVPTELCAGVSCE